MRRIIMYNHNGRLQMIKEDECLFPGNNVYTKSHSSPLINYWIYLVFENCLLAADTRMLRNISIWFHCLLEKGEAPIQCFILILITIFYYSNVYMSYQRIFGIIATMLLLTQSEVKKGCLLCYHVVRKYSSCNLSVP